MAIHSSTIQLLRFHFSFFLLPVYLFALAWPGSYEVGKAVWAGLILHLLVYPSSNGYNSYMDRDETPIGGLARPMHPTRQLFITSVVMDIAAVLLSLAVSLPLAVGIIFYIAASRAYSYRGIRLKKHAIPGFITVFIFQGAWIFFTVVLALHNNRELGGAWLPACISSLLIGALYPLTQVYQHEADRKDGVTTISMKLGIRGSFLFTMLLFLLATVCMYSWLEKEGIGEMFSWFLLIMAPVVLYFLYWMLKAWKQPGTADFRHSLTMNTLSTLCTTAFFILLINKTH